ncbi:MAG: acyl-CoA reductase [Bacteroidota bacterium]
MNTNIEKQIKVFDQLGKIILDFCQRETNGRELTEKIDKKIKNGIIKTEEENPWFTRDFQCINLKAWGENLNRHKLKSWLMSYPEAGVGNARKKVGLILAGNIPLVGFHDILCVLISGHYAVTKLSSKDRILYPILKEILREIDQATAERWMIIEDEKLTGIDAVIATGSDNSARYFEYYFGKYPHIIRKNRNSVAVLSGNETEKEIRALGDDLFLYFGLGCRNVSKLYVPNDFSPEQFYPYIEHYAYLYHHTKYANNYDYQKAVHLVNKVPIYDNGFLLLKEEKSISSPVACLNYEKYHHLEEVNHAIGRHFDRIQCIVSGIDQIPQAVPFGKSQFPGLYEYADNIDTLKFLFNLYEKYA